MPKYETIDQFFDEPSTWCFRPVSLEYCLGQFSLLICEFEKDLDSRSLFGVRVEPGQVVFEFFYRSFRL